MFWGPTGTGKTRVVYKMFPDVFSLLDETGKWFDGYMGHENALFDDFDGASIGITYLLKLADRYPFRVQIKGGTVNWRPRRLFITSNINPDQWYASANKASIGALFRRIDVLREFPCDEGLINFSFE